MELPSPAAPSHADVPSRELSPSRQRVRKSIYDKIYGICRSQTSDSILLSESGINDCKTNGGQEYYGGLKEGESDASRISQSSPEKRNIGRVNLAHKNEWCDLKEECKAMEEMEVHTHIYSYKN